ncbi:hypothetical protein HDV00_003142 [Rhizophlyctis rosea]|nr:hypothetical protein HDV00_003142 [Rhizophlyctis rosea]
MGTAESKHAGNLPGTLSEAEKASISDVYNSVGQHAGQGNTLTFAAFSASTFPTLPPNLATAFVAYCCVKSSKTSTKIGFPTTPQTPVTLAGFATAIHILCTGSAYDRQEFVTVYEKVVEKPHTQSFIRDIAHGLQFYQPSNAKPSGNPEYEPSARFVDFLLSTISTSTQTADDVFSDSSTAPPPQPPPLSSFATFFPTSTYLQTVFTLLFTGTFLPPSPRATKHPLLAPPKSTLLTREDIYLLNEALPSEVRLDTWTGLFSSERDGGSWTVFHSRVEEAGATVVVVKDKTGNVFGGFAGTEWSVKPKFYGDSSSFLFSLQPSMRIYRPTGINQNYQYFNHGMHTLPNGIGFGGQLNYFGLWIDSSFERGHSRGNPRSTTYDNPQLSGTEEFEIDFVEAWLIKPKEVDDRLVDTKNKGSILSSNPEAEAILEMSGRTMHSKAYREPVRDEELEQG